MNLFEGCTKSRVAVINPNGTAMANPSDNNAQQGFNSASSVASLPLTSGVPVATTTVRNLVTTTLQVASGYTTVTKGAVGAGAGGAGATGSSSQGAPMATGAIGMAALFGGAAFAANL